MTYCVAMRLNQGLLFASDSRTNAGVDHVSTFSKMNVIEQSGERCLVLLNAGNLATTQSVVTKLRKLFGSDEPNLMNVTSLFDAAQLLGDEVKNSIASYEKGQINQSSVDFSCSFLLGGQIKGEHPRLFMIYPAGNFIEATRDTPYFQIGESKYGKPIIDRVVKPETSLREAVKCALVSFDSTMRSNLSVGLPVDLALVNTEAFQVTFRHRIESNDPYFGAISQQWGDGLRTVFNALQPPDWLDI
jgi:putative proteasome-type protease